MICQESAVGHLRVGVIVSKKFSPLAVARNTQKRAISAVLEELLPKSAPLDVIVSYTHAGKMLSYKDVKAVLKPELTRILREIPQNRAPKHVPREDI